SAGALRRLACDRGHRVGMVPRTLARHFADPYRCPGAVASCVLRGRELRIKPSARHKPRARSNDRCIDRRAHARTAERAKGVAAEFPTFDKPITNGYPSLNVV